MTIQELSRLHDLNALIEYHKGKLAELRASTQPGAQVMSGMPHAPGTRDKLGELIPAIVDLEQKINQELAEYERQKARVEEYISEITDPHVRIIFILRFIDKLTWDEVAGELCGANNTSEAVRAVVRRQLKK